MESDFPEMVMNRDTPGYEVLKAENPALYQKFKEQDSVWRDSYSKCEKLKDESDDHRTGHRERSSAQTDGKKWFLTLYVRTHSNAGSIGPGQNNVPWKETFETRDECYAKFHKIKNSGMRTDIALGSACSQFGTGGYGVSQVTGFCQRLRQQLEPACAPTPEYMKEYYPDWLEQ